MSKTFLAEDFRKLMDALEDINADAKDDQGKDADTGDAEQHRDIKDLLSTDRPEGIKIEDVKDVMDLIKYLDQYPELDQWRNDSAEYDDAYYEDLPLDKLLAVANLTKDDLDRIEDQTDQYEGRISILGDTLDIFGGS